MKFPETVQSLAQFARKALSYPAAFRNRSVARAGFKLEQTGDDEPGEEQQVIGLSSIDSSSFPFPHSWLLVPPPPVGPRQNLVQTMPGTATNGSPNQ